jgi:apolipoprotein N-acyltransferase
MVRKVQREFILEALLSGALALVAALAWRRCFEQETASLLPWVALVPLLLLLGSRQPFLWFWLFGVTFWTFSLSWLAPTLTIHGGLHPVLSHGLTLLSALYLGRDQAVFAWGGRS